MPRSLVIIRLTLADADFNFCRLVTTAKVNPKTFQTPVGYVSVRCQPIPEDMSRFVSRGVVRIRCTSDNKQCATYLGYEYWNYIHLFQQVTDGSGFHNKKEFSRAKTRSIRLYVVALRRRNYFVCRLIPWSRVLLEKLVVAPRPSHFIQFDRPNNAL
jgi:hypothetical protein